VSTNRIASLILVTLLALCRTVSAETSGLEKYRALLVTGERLVVYSGRLTSDSLIGSSFSGAARSIPLRSISSLERATGTHAGKGA
jgi:hypothetical protein